MKFEVRGTLPREGILDEIAECPPERAQFMFAQWRGEAHCETGSGPTEWWVFDIEDCRRTATPVCVVVVSE